MRSAPEAESCYAPGDTIGQAGVEAAFDRYLRGSPASPIFASTRSGSRGPLQTAQEAVAGKAVQLTIDVSLQRAAERALEYGIQIAHADNHWNANGGRDRDEPDNGEVLAMASSPTFNPSVFVGRTDPKKLAPLLDPAARGRTNYPGLDRATAGLYPPGRPSSR